MKQIAILLLMAIFATTAGIAQEKQQKEKAKKDLPSPLIEVWGGMGPTSVSGTEQSTSNRLGGLFGVAFTYPLTVQNNLHFEGGYSFQGFKYLPVSRSYQDTTLSLDEAEQRFNYFIITVQDRYFFDKKRTYYVNGGFYASYLAQAKFQAGFNIKGPDGLDEYQEIDESNEASFTTFDFGLTGGAGVRLGNKSMSNFTIELRFAYGLVNIAKTSYLNEDPKARNFYGVIKLGIDIPVMN